MHSVRVSKKQRLLTKTGVTIIAIAVAVALPQVFHLLGIASGLGSTLGATFLPMHLPVLMAGLMLGPIIGAVAGAVSPVISFAFVSMPSSGLLPFMVVELFVYGLVSGLISKAKLPTFLKLLTAQVVGRLIRAASIIFAIYLLDRKMSIKSTYDIVKTGLPGIMLQWLVVPLLSFRLKSIKNFI